MRFLPLSLFSIRGDADCGHRDSGSQLGERTKRCAYTGLCCGTGLLTRRSSASRDECCPDKQQQKDDCPHFE
jgi:hypothetical protein